MTEAGSRAQEGSTSKRRLATDRGKTKNQKSELNASRVKKSCFLLIMTLNFDLLMPGGLYVRAAAARPYYLPTTFGEIKFGRVPLHPWRILKP
jgi:hypothetical protein